VGDRLSVPIPLTPKRNDFSQWSPALHENTWSRRARTRPVC
jgi:hypothetical protein